MNKSRLARMDRVVTHSTKSNLRTRSENNSFRMVAETLLVRSLFMPQPSDWKYTMSKILTRRNFRMLNKKIVDRKPNH